MVVGVFLSLILSPNIISVVTPKNNYTNANKAVIVQLMKYCADDACLVMLPYHPIFAYDATWLYSYWQFYYTDEFPEVKKEIINKNMCEQIKRSRPAVVACTLNKKDFLLELFQKGLISKEDYKNLATFLEANYTVKRIGKNRYYVRNDKL
jgi:hypothetical protein